MTGTTLGIVLTLAGLVIAASAYRRDPVEGSSGVIVFSQGQATARRISLPLVSLAGLCFGCGVTLAYIAGVAHA